VNGTVQNPVHTYVLPGTYSVSLNATNTFGSNTRTRTGFVTVSAPVRSSRIGIFRPATHQFLLRTGSGTAGVNWGTSTDLPVTGDWNGDSLTDVGIFRPANHLFYLKNGSTTTTVNWGLSTDLPVTGDWDGDGLTDIGVFRPTTHLFYLKSGSLTTAINWGTGTDKPVTGRWS
jgi:PKD repeat protein